MKKITILLPFIFAFFFISNAVAQDPGPVPVKSICAKVEIKGPIGLCDQEVASGKASAMLVELRVVAIDYAVAIAGFEVTTPIGITPVLKYELAVKAGPGQAAKDELIKKISLGGNIVPFQARVYAEAGGYLKTSYAYASSALTW